MHIISLPCSISFFSPEIVYFCVLCSLKKQIYFARYIDSFIHIKVILYRINFQLLLRNYKYKTDIVLIYFYFYTVYEVYKAIYNIVMQSTKLFQLLCLFHHICIEFKLFSKKQKEKKKYLETTF